MIHVEKGTVHVQGTRQDVLMDFGTVVAAMADEFGIEETTNAVATAIVVLHGKASKVDLSGLTNALDKLKIDGEDEEDE